MGQIKGDGTVLGDTGRTFKRRREATELREIEDKSEKYFKIIRKLDLVGKPK